MFVFFLSCIALVTAFAVTHLRSPIHSILCLIWTFFNVALLVFTLGLDFFALIYIIIYVGAIAILFLFIIMTLNLKRSHLFVNVRYHFLFSSVLGLLFIIPLWSYLVSDLSYFFVGQGTFINWVDASLTTTNLKTLGLALYTRYSLCFIIAGLILFVAMVGAILLTGAEVVEPFRHQEIYAQLQRMPQTSVFLVTRLGS